MKNVKIKEKIKENKIPQEVTRTLEILDELEVFTADLRKRLMNEIRPKGNVVRLKLDEV